MTSAHASKTAPSASPQRDTANGSTRQQVLNMLLKHGPLTAGELAAQLGITGAGTRRHLDILLREDLAEQVDHVPGNGACRGRPPKAFRLTSAGRSTFGGSYEALAVDALFALRESAGPEAVRQVLRGRIEKILAGVEATGGRDQVEDAVRAVAEAFDENGYAATVENTEDGITLCQHHCPVSHVAQQFPELCEAEHELIAEITGATPHISSSIAHGGQHCTTSIPLTPTSTVTETP